MLSYTSQIRMNLYQEFLIRLWNKTWLLIQRRKWTTQMSKWHIRRKQMKSILSLCHRYLLLSLSSISQACNFFVCFPLHFKFIFSRDIVIMWHIIANPSTFSWQISNFKLFLILLFFDFSWTKNLNSH